MSYSLAQLERLFWHTSRGRLDARVVARELRSHAGLDAVARMTIYRDMFFARQIDALAHDFKLLARELGAQAFARLARDYVLQHPSEAPGLEWLGRNLADFLRARACEPRLCDIAAIEWTSCRALLAPPDPIASEADLAPERWPAARFRLSQSLHTLAVEDSAFEAFAGHKAATAGSVVLALWRQEFAVRHAEVASDEHAALALVRDGASWSEVCAAFDDAPRAYQVLRGWLGRSWIAELMPAA